ncbi:MAG: YihY/virulence factor BrkB family protein [Leucobacter sp.]
MSKVQEIAKQLIAWALRQRIVRAFLLYSNHQGAMLADSITYRALFSVFAAVLLGFTIAALWLGGNPDAMRALSESLNSVIPGMSNFIGPETVQAPAGFTIVGVISLLGLVGAAISAIGRLRAALRMLANQVADDTGFLWVLVRNLLVAVAFGGLLGVAAAASFLGSVGIDAVIGWFGISSGSLTSLVLTRGLGVLTVLIVDTLAVALVFRLLSGITPPASALWGGAILGGVGLTVLQELSGLFVRGATSNPLLASFASLIALLLWFNLSSQVILIASSYIVTATEESHDRVRAKFGAATMQSWRRIRAENAVHAAEVELRAAQEAERQSL